MNQTMDGPSLWDDEEAGVIPDHNPIETPQSGTVSIRHRILPFAGSLCLIVIAGVVGWGIRGAFLPSGSVGKVTNESVSGVVSMSQGTSSRDIGNAAFAGTSSYEIKVDVQGDVLHPGVVSLSDTARVQDAVRAAGGFRHQKDSALVNTAELVTDGEEIVVPGPTSVDVGGGEPTGVTPEAAQSVTVNQSPGVVPVRPDIDLNTATESALETLPEIGPGRAAAILSYRTAHGPFASVSDLRKVHGIGPTIYGRISPFLFVAAQAR